MKIIRPRYERYPLTAASIVLARKLKWLPAKARQFLLVNNFGEPNHYPRYSETLYYDVSDNFINTFHKELNSYVFDHKVSWRFYKQ